MIESIVPLNYGNFSECLTVLVYLSPLISKEKKSRFSHLKKDLIHNGSIKLNTPQNFNSKQEKYPDECKDSIFPPHLVSVELMHCRLNSYKINCFVNVLPYVLQFRGLTGIQYSFSSWGKLRGKKKK